MVKQKQKWVGGEGREEREVRQKSQLSTRKGSREVGESNLIILFLPACFFPHDSIAKAKGVGRYS